MKTKLAALAGTLALTLVMSTLVGAKPELGPFLASGQGVTPDENQTLDGTCPVVIDEEGNDLGPSTEILDVFQNLTGGGGGGTASMDFDIAGLEFPGETFTVTVTITWYADNTFDIVATGGWFHKIGVKAGEAEFVYDYVDIDTFPGGGIEGKVSWDTGLNKRDGTKSQDASHLDFCLSAEEIPPNTSLISECTTADGCDPSGRQLNNYPLALAGQGFDNETVTQEPLTAIYEAQDTTCGLDPLDGMTVINPYIARDPRVNDDGSLKSEMEGPLDLTTLFDFSQWIPDPGDTCYPGDICNGVFAPASVVGTPCIAGLKGTNSAEFVDFFEAGVPLDDWTFIVTQDDADWNAFTVLQPGPVSDSDGFRDLSRIEQAVLQVDDLALRNYPEDAAGAFTLQVTNPKSLKSGRGTVYLFLMREACVNVVRPDGLDLSVATSDGVAYLQAVEDCKVQLALEYLDNMELALFSAEEAGAMIESINFYLTPLNKIRNMFDNRNFKKAINDADQFCDRVIGTDWNVLFENDPGGLSMRCSNISHRAQELLIAEGIKDAWIKELK